MGRLSHQSHTERGANSAHDIESRRTIGAQGFVQRFPRDHRRLGDLQDPVFTSKYRWRSLIPMSLSLEYAPGSLAAVWAVGVVRHDAFKNWPENDDRYLNIQ